MLSILIPTYNYNVYPLAQNLWEQCRAAGIPFELIAVDDGSHSPVNSENEKINKLQNSRFISLEKNTGRSAARNSLAKMAGYDWLLFLDADTIPVGNDLILKYLPYMDTNEKVVYGGIKYQNKKPEANEVLRWIYGNDREALPLSIRLKNPHKRLLTLNFLTHRNVFNSVSFNETIPNLRHEDSLFSYELMLAKAPVLHIENEVYHHGLESSEVFLRKSEESLVGLKYLLNNKLIGKDYIDIGKVYTKIHKNGLDNLIALFYKTTKGIMRKNLLGSKPSLFIFDLYRLGYICNLKTKKGL